MYNKCFCDTVNFIVFHSRKKKDRVLITEKGTTYVQKGIIPRQYILLPLVMIKKWVGEHLTFSYNK